MNLTKKILVVEDNPADVELTRLSFQNISFPAELLAFQNGEELMNYLPGVAADEIALILLDLNMPRMSGKDVLKTLQKSQYWRTIPVVVFTSSLHKEDILNCYELGANAYVSKPIDLSEYDRTIKAIANFWGGINRRANELRLEA
jgi:CheY-like chemotaxis protein